MRKAFLIRSSITILFFIALSCSTTADRKELSISKGYYHYVDSNDRYTGVLYTYYKNGNIESKGYMKNGIPINKFQYYGYNSDLINTEEYKPISIKKFKNKIIRGYILTSIENEVVTNSINLIILYEKKDSININQMKHEFRELILDKNVSQIKLREGEFEQALQVYDI